MLTMNVGGKWFWAVSFGLAFLISIGPASAQVLTPAQIVKPADLTEKESAYYQKLTDPLVAKNFLETRSYVRLCQKIIDHKMPAIQLPDKPPGFSVRYILPGEAQLINKAIAENIIAGMKEDRAKQ
jgi:hypothetical protein